MPKKLILHAGLPKTGTTSIQNAFYRTRDLLLGDARMLYPSVAPNHTNAVCTMFLKNPETHITNKIGMLKADFDLARVRVDYFEALEADMARGEWDTVLISAEGISNLSAEEIAGFRDWALEYVDTFEVVFWTRDPVKYTVSVIQQIIKGGQTIKSLADDLPLPNFRGKISNAIAVFGAEAVKVRDFESAITQEDGIVGAFCRDVGLTADLTARIVEHATRDNEALSLEAAMMLDRLNELRPLFDNDGAQARRTGGEIQYLQAVRGNRFDIPFALRKACHEQSRADVAWLNKTFGLDLYTEPFTEEQPQPAPLDMSTITSSAILMSNLINTVEGLKLTLQAHEAYHNNELDMARSKLAEAQRFTPESGHIQVLRQRLN
ncbi:MAG: hypothetical protein AAFQ51_00165 [Pseudomonadota bacterium]